MADREVSVVGERDRAQSRRRFLRRAGLAGLAVPVAGGLLAGCSESGGADQRAAQETGAQGTASDPAGGAHAGMSGDGASLSVDDMDAQHAQGMATFLKNQTEPVTRGKGNVLLPFTMDGDVKVFALTVDDLEWEVEPGTMKTARGYNGMTPGPVIRATEADMVRINVTNNLQESTTVHWHGLFVPAAMDGVPFLSQEPIKPGQTFTYEFRLRNAGTHWYHSHLNSFQQTNSGLMGLFIIDPKDPSGYPAYDREYFQVLNDTMLGFTINGKGFPATEALYAKQGERVLIRYLNGGEMLHPMHLHGMPMQVFAKDGWPLPAPYRCDTLLVEPGNRYDVLVEATEAGRWLFHCHILSHAESPTGMFGLATALIVES